MMKTSVKYTWAVGAILALAAFVSIPSWAQSFPSKWYFGKPYTEQFAATWEAEGYAAATVSGAGVMTATDAQGNPLKEVSVFKGRPAIETAQAGDCFMFDVPADKVEAGSFISFDATMSADPGAPMCWAVEWNDGGKWVKGREYLFHGPAIGKNYRYTTIHQVFKLDNPIENGSVKVRIRAMEGALVKDIEGVKRSGRVMLVTSTFIGAYVHNYGPEQPKDTTRVLCIGNSFTYYHSCPAMLKEIAWTEGHYLDMSASVKGGWSMNDHRTYEITQDLVKEGGYDIVFLQNQSQGPAKVGQDRKANASLVDDVVAVAEMVKSTSPDCRTVVECTWAYPGKNYGGFGTVAAFDKYAVKGRKIMAKAIGKAEISPISKAFKLSREERPDILLYSPDGYHQSPYGSYLKSCVNYLLLFGEPFGENTSDCGLEKDRAAALRNIAEIIVLNKK